MRIYGYENTRFHVRGAGVTTFFETRAIRDAALSEMIVHAEREGLSGAAGAFPRVTRVVRNEQRSAICDSFDFAGCYRSAI